MKSTFVLSLLFLGVTGCTSMVLAQSAGTFTATGNLTRERMYHAATLLTNGRVLITGGFTGGYVGAPGSSVWASAELYDPSTGTFTATGNMTTPRHSHTATLLPDGKVLIAGGGPVSADFRLSLIQAELYDPATGTFTATGDMTTARSWHTATLLNSGKVLIAGGLYETQGATSAELYDPATGIFTATGSMLNANYWFPGAAALLSNGKVLIPRSLSDEDPAPAELYDLDTGTFSLTGETRQAWMIPATASLLTNGEVLVTLGVGENVIGNSAEVYDPSNGTFTATGNMTKPRGYSTATLLPDGTVLIAGREGYRLGGSAELYDPVTDTFSTTGDLAAQREEGHTATLLPDGTVLMAGGWVCCGRSIATADIYRPAVLVRSPVLFSLAGGVQGAIQHAGTVRIASADDPAVAGEYLSIYLTGMADGSVIPPQVAIGGKLAEITFFGNVPGYTGLNVINVRMPSGVTPGSAVGVRLTYLARLSNEVTIGVR
jgi:Galactose oxidase, central domain